MVLAGRAGQDWTKQPAGFVEKETTRKKLSKEKKTRRKRGLGKTIKTKNPKAPPKNHYTGTSRGNTQADNQEVKN